MMVSRQQYYEKKTKDRREEVEAERIIKAIDIGDNKGKGKSIQESECIFT
jgi:hypothetical protein